MIAKIQIFLFFDILKNEKHITLNNLYGSEKQADKKQYDLQTHFQQNKD
jgi:hypothetical protein